jgi:hypothetical protein
VVTVTGGAHDRKCSGALETMVKTTNPDWIKTMFIETDASMLLLKFKFGTTEGSQQDDPDW